MIQKEMVIVAGDATLDELRGLSCQCGLLVTKNPDSKGMYLMIAGYDDDPRELWQIEEVKALCCRIIESGLISSLVYSTTLPGSKTTSPACGAFEVWWLSIGRMKPGAPIERSALDSLNAVLHESNKVADKLMEENKPSEIHALILDGRKAQ